MLHRGGGDGEDIGVAARDVMACEHFGQRLDESLERWALLLRGAHADDGGHGEAELLEIDLSAVAGDEPGVLHAPHALGHRRRGEPTRRPSALQLTRAFSCRAWRISRPALSSSLSILSLMGAAQFRDDGRFVKTPSIGPFASVRSARRLSVRRDSHGPDRSGAQRADRAVREGPGPAARGDRRGAGGGLHVAAEAGRVVRARGGRPLRGLGDECRGAHPLSRRRAGSAGARL